MKISVLGTGCPTCKKLHTMVDKVVKDGNIKAEVEYSTDITRIVELGLMTSPVLVVDGKVINLKSLSEKAIKEALCSNTDTECCADRDSCDINCKLGNNNDTSCSCGGNS